MVNFQYKSHYDLQDLLEVMRVLRGPGGCPWDREQTHESIRRNLLEETYEAADAIDRADLSALQEELGDVLMQVVFHAQIETERAASSGRRGGWGVQKADLPSPPRLWHGPGG